jgi:predicted ferric reductase
MNSQLLWYSARANGIVAWALLAASVLWGLALSTEAFGRRPRPAWLLDLHRYLGGAALVFTGLHVVSIMLDTYVHFGLVEVLVPFATSWHPAAVAWGIASFYLLAAVEITSLLRSRLPHRWWRATHFLSFPLFVTATLHGMWGGTDKRVVVLRLGYVVVLGAATLLAAFRIADATVEGGGRRRRDVPRAVTPA